MNPLFGTRPKLLLFEKQASKEQAEIYIAAQIKLIIENDFSFEYFREDYIEIHMVDCGLRVYDRYVKETFWFSEGRLHREDGPAVERANGTKIWFKHGKRHRKDGPAVEKSNYRAWYENEVFIKDEYF